MKFAGTAPPPPLEQGGKALLNPSSAHPTKGLGAVMKNSGPLQGRSGPAALEKNRRALWILDHTTRGIMGM